MYLTPKQESLVAYIAQGLKPGQVATLLGVTPAYISQCLKDEKIAQAIEDAKIKASGSDQETEERIINKLKATEERIIDAISDAIPYAEGPVLAKLLDTIAARLDRRKGLLAPGASLSLTQNNTVTLTLPAHAIPAPAVAYHTNEANQITSIGNQLMAHLSSEGVRNLFSQMRNPQGSKSPILTDPDTLDFPAEVQANDSSSPNSH